MKKTRWILWLLALMALTLTSACSNDDSPTGTTPSDAPEFTGSSNTITVPAGMANSDDPNAMMASAYIGMANAIGGHGAMFTPPTRAMATDGPPWEYSWTEGTLTITLIINETDTMYTWDVYIDGTIDQEVYDDYLFYSAWSDIDGSCGGLTFYAYDSSGMMEWEWCTDALGVFTMTMSFSDGMNTVAIDLLVNADGSGEISYVFNGITVFEAIWDALGNGEWWTWDEGGTPTGSGTWSAVLN
jgi:hypothetical protein